MGRPSRNAEPTQARLRYHGWRRSYLILDAGRYYGSTQIFADTMRRFIELGISEIGVGYPRANQLSVFEAIARETIPRLKEEYVLI